ncbi:unnamed protein product [Acanthoscelides obtectus]|uniref:Uncharacterized protein n=1 Tax=Acanthoscelides obtectus TaxID=200917 RepID=A0A9P0PGQ6_ACAOB|nr:unnamed protein product [Acanthoscelides obtectus]CAK1623409.1 Mitochondrial ornithine transporter 1 [Acanthoscelides obtectus]
MTLDVSEEFKDAAVDLLSGVVAGTVYVYVGQPLDTCKTKMQTFPHLYKNGLQCLLKTARHDGLRGLYAGTGPSLITSTSEYSILFFSYGGVKKFLKYMMGVPYSQHMSTLFYATAGCMSSFFSSLAICPTELVKSRVQVQKELAKYKFGGRKEITGPTQVVSEILERDGVRGMFRGLGATLAREMPGYFVYFYSYEYMRNTLRRPDQKKYEIGPVKTMIAGSTAGGMFWASTFPIDVIKSRIQVSATKDNMFVVGYKILRGKRISKVKTLQSAIKYIRELELMLHTSNYVESYSHFEGKYFF